MEIHYYYCIKKSIVDISSEIIFSHFSSALQTSLSGIDFSLNSSLPPTPPTHTHSLSGPLLFLSICHTSAFHTLV